MAEKALHARLITQLRQGVLGGFPYHTGAQLRWCWLLAELCHCVLQAGRDPGLCSPTELWGWVGQCVMCTPCLCALWGAHPLLLLQGEQLILLQLRCLLHSHIFPTLRIVSSETFHLTLTFPRSQLMFFVCFYPCLSWTSTCCQAIGYSGPEREPMNFSGSCSEPLSPLRLQLQVIPILWKGGGLLRASERGSAGKGTEWGS